MHNLEIVDGKASMVYNKQWGNLWHELGTAVEGAMTAEQALELSHQNFQVERFQLEYDGKPVDAYGLFRTDTMTILGTCTDKYVPIQNVTQFDVIDTLLETSSGAHYDTAGVLGRGEKVWALARIPEADINVGNDKHETYLLATTTHDRTEAFIVKLVSIRVVCQNTLSMALSRNGSMTRIRHSRQAMDRLEAAKDYLKMVAKNAHTLQEKLDILAGRKMTKESYISVMDRLFPIRKDAEGEIIGETHRNNILGEIIRLYESNDRNAYPEFKGTAYNLLNAVTEYTDHLRSGRMTEDREAAGYSLKAVRAESALFGSGETLKERALEIILEDTKGNPVISTVAQQFTTPSVEMLSTTGSALLDQVVDANQA
jgi:phage/plasmid-like protein (TIGR03299 family)